MTATAPPNIEAPPEPKPEFELREIVDGKHLKLHFHPGQERVWNSTARFVFMFAGVQSGKTSFGPHWLEREIRTAFAKMKGSSTLQVEGLGDFLAVSSTYDMFKLNMLPQMRIVFEDLLHIGRYWSGEKLIELTENLIPTTRGGVFRAKRIDDLMFGRIILRSAESDSGMESVTAKAAWLDEVGQSEYKLDTWDAILSRVARHRGRILGTTTVYNTGWLKTTVYDRAKAGDKRFDIIQFDSTENPNFSVEEFEERRAEMDSWRFRMRYQGQYDKPAGLIYSVFDEATMQLPRFSVDKDWLWYTGHDFGGQNPAAMVFAEDPSSGFFYAVHEYRPSSQSTFEQARDLKTLLQDRAVVRRQGGAHNEEGWRNDYTSQGWPISEPPDVGVEVGIGRVVSLFKTGRLFVFSDLQQFLGELNSYSRKLDANYEPTDEIANKARFHLMDAMRYALCGMVPDRVSTGPAQTQDGSF